MVGYSGEGKEDTTQGAGYRGGHASLITSTAVKYPYLPLSNTFFHSAKHFLVLKKNCKLFLLNFDRTI